MDFLVEKVIHAGTDDVARIMFDPDLEDQWGENAGKPERLTPGPLAVGARIRHQTSLIGIGHDYVTEVTALDPGRRLEMKVVEGPVQGVLIYQVSPTAGGSIASVHLRDAKGRLPHSTWLRKQQVEESLDRLNDLVIHHHPPA